MSGLEFVLPLNTIADTRLRRDRGPERARGYHGGTKWQPAHPAGTVHGGLSARCSITVWASPYGRHCKKGIGQTTLELKVSFVRPITAETEMIMTEGVVLSRGPRRIGTAEGRITDRDGRLLAHGTTTSLICES
jgi:uncharacterized protein (TIGR00369 family)